MNRSSSDRIEKRVELKATISRVWRALTDYKEFGQWFKVDLDGPFAPGKKTSGAITYPGYEHLTMHVTVEKMEEERLFSFRWHPHAVDADFDYSNEPTTLVEFRLEEMEDGTLLEFVESGFDGIPVDRRDEAYFRNDRGWTEQMKNIESYLADKS